MRHCIALGLLALCACGSSDWTFEQGKHPMTDQPMLSATATDGRGNYLVVNCSESGGPTLIVQANRRMGGLSPDNNYQPRMISYRADGNRVRETVGSIGDNMIAFVSESRRDWDAPIMEQMVGASTLALSTTDHRGDEVMMVFPISGSQAIFDRFHDGCQRGGD